MKNIRNRLIKQLVAILALLMLSSPAWALGYNNQHVLESLRWVAIITQDFCILAGVGFMLGGLFKMKRYGEMRTFMSHQLTLGKPLSMIIVGACLLAIPVAVKTIMLAIYGQVNPLPYPDAGSGSAEVIKPVIILVRLVGLFGLIRGIMLFTRIGGEQGQPGMLGKAMLHIIGGVLCIHIINTYNILKFMLGFT